jgi:hypothetical protein
VAATKRERERERAADAAFLRRRLATAVSSRRIRPPSRQRRGEKNREWPSARPSPGAGGRSRAVAGRRPFAAESATSCPAVARVHPGLALLDSLCRRASSRRLSHQPLLRGRQRVRGRVAPPSGKRRTERAAGSGPQGCPIPTSAPPAPASSLQPLRRPSAGRRMQHPAERALRGLEAPAAPGCVTGAESAKEIVSNGAEEDRTTGCRAFHKDGSERCAARFASAQAVALGRLAGSSHRTGPGRAPGAPARRGALGASSAVAARKPAVR